MDYVEDTFDTANVMIDRLLDEKLAESDPFQATMGLVFLSQLGLEWNHEWYLEYMPPLHRRLIVLSVFICFFIRSKRHWILSTEWRAGLTREFEHIYLHNPQSPSYPTNSSSGPVKMSFHAARHVFSATARSSVRLHVNACSIRMGAKRMNSSHAPKQSSDRPWIVRGFSIASLSSEAYWCTVSYRLLLP